MVMKYFQCQIFFLQKRWEIFSFLATADWAWQTVPERETDDKQIMRIYSDLLPYIYVVTRSSLLSQLCWDLETISLPTVRVYKKYVISWFILLSLLSAQPFFICFILSSCLHIISSYFRIFLVELEEELRIILIHHRFNWNRFFPLNLNLTNCLMPDTNT